MDTTLFPSYVNWAELLTIPLPSVTWDEPLITLVPSSVLNTEPLITPVPFKFLSTEPLITPVPSSVLKTEPLITPVPSKFLNTLPLTTPSPLELIYLVSNSVVNCADEETVPAGTEPPPLGNVIVLPLDILRSLPLIESVCESVSDVK